MQGTKIEVRKGEHYFIFGFRTPEEFADQLESFCANPDLNFNEVDVESILYQFVCGWAHNGHL